jgi:hypothetical protein
MEPSELREHILADHRMLRGAAARLGELVQRCDCTAPTRPTCASIAGLLDLVRVHLEEEDAALGPVLQHIDPWGPVRAAHLQERRLAERERMSEMLARLAHPLDDGPLRAHVLAFVEWLDGELTIEEQEELSERLLGDDPILDDTFTG